MLRRILMFLALFAGIVAAGEGHAERRVALVVGNAHYEHASTLRNPLNDAADLAEVLKKLGFEVLVAQDLDQRAFARQIDQFGRMLEGADVGLFFYAGHGLQVNEKNYLVSTKARLENEFLIPAETVELDAIIRLMESRTRINLVFLDACRNNPLADKLRQNLVASNRSVSLGRGLARVEPTGRDTLIAFAAAPGQEAADGRERNSPFTAALLNHLPKPGVEVSVMLKEVTAQVRRETHNAQRPQQLSDMSRTFYFAKAEPAAPVVTPAPAPRVAQPVPDHSIELAYWNSARSVNDCDSVRAYLERYPNGIFADLAKLSERRLCEVNRRVTVVETEPPPPATPKPAVAEPAPTLVPAAAPAPVPTAPATAPAASDPAESKVAALSSPSETPATPEPDSETQTEIARDLQRELERVGCSAGKPDGIWGARSRSALREFNQHARASLDADLPSREAVAALQKHRTRVCPSEEAPTRARREPVQRRERVRPVERQPAPVSRPAVARDWRSINPKCQSAYYSGSKLCCTYDPPNGPPVIICP